METLPGRWNGQGSRGVPYQPMLLAYASNGSHEHTRLRSPYAPSMRDTGGKYFDTRSEGNGKAPSLAAVRAVPVAEQFLGGVRRMAQRTVADRPFAGRHPVDLGGDRDHRVAEAIELAQRLALGRLDHQGAGHREAHRRRMEPVVHQPLGDVVDGDPGRLRDGTDVDDALVRHPPVALLYRTGKCGSSRSAM